MSYIVTKQLKSTGIAVFLAVLFGGIGLFYSTILGGIIMTLIFPVALFTLFLTGKFFLSILLACSYYVICFIWAIVGVRSYNKRIQRKSVSNKIESTNEDDVNSSKQYYEQYRESLKSDHTIFWLAVTIVIACLLFCGAYRFSDMVK